MSTPARTQASDKERREVLSRLVDELDEALTDVEIARAEVGEAERRGRHLVVPVAIEVAEEVPATSNAAATQEEKSWSEEDPEGFEEAVAYILDKNRELYRRLS